MSGKSLLAVFLSVGLLVASGCTRRPPAAVVDLAGSLSDLTNVALFAQAPLGRAALISTYDQTGGNDDFAKLATLPKAGDDLYVLADLKGPGRVDRIWMTSVLAEEWLFFFDGEKTPRIRAKGNDFFGIQAPFTPPLCDHVSGGFYSYMPLPYAKSLKIAVRWPNAKPDARPYYQIHYETYDDSVKVVSFPPSFGLIERTELDVTRKAWRESDIAIAELVARDSDLEGVPVAPGKSAVWCEKSGAGVLRSFWLHVTPGKDATELQRSALLRALVVKFYWDGAAKPSVEVPLGDFFCNGLHARRFSSLALGRADSSFACRFPMPFRGSIRAELQNDSAIPVTVDRYCEFAPLAASNEVNYFHATWNSSASSMTPFRVARAEGRGHLVGTYLTQIGTDGSWNMFEGDDILWLDGESQASFHGTGMEDYFNGGWYYSGLFDLPLHGLIDKAPIRSSQYRLHLPDRIAFTNGMMFTFEFGDRNMGHGYMSSVAYWYQPEPHPVPPVPPVAQRVPPADPLEPTAIMSALFELERIGHDEEAADRCREYAEKVPSSPWGQLLGARALAYREKVEGYPMVSNEYARVMAQAAGTPLAAQVADLMWFHESPQNALLGIHPMGRHRVYLDGRFVGEGDDPVSLVVFRLALTPGEHELAVELAPTRQHGQFSLYLRAHTTNVVADASWEYVRKKPEAWPQTGGADAAWKPVEDANYMLPSMMYWQFVPNAYVDMQSMPHLVRPFAGWLEGHEQAYLRKRFTVPALPQGELPEQPEGR